MFIINTKKGFTLIEVIIYIALFSLLMGSAFVVTYQLIDGSSKLSKKNVIQEEGNFVVRKLNWALTGAEAISTSGSNLVITKYDGSEIRFCLDAEKIKIRQGGSASCSSSNFTPITTDNVQVSNFNLTPISGTPSGVTVNVTINGVDFNITKYIRQ